MEQDSDQSPERWERDDQTEVEVEEGRVFMWLKVVYVVVIVVCLAYFFLHHKAPV